MRAAGRALAVALRAVVLDAAVLAPPRAASFAAVLVHAVLAEAGAALLALAAAVLLRGAGLGAGQGDLLRRLRCGGLLLPLGARTAELHAEDAVDERHNI